MGPNYWWSELLVSALETSLLVILLFAHEEMTLQGEMEKSKLIARRRLRREWKVMREAGPAKILYILTGNLGGSWWPLWEGMNAGQWSHLLRVVESCQKTNKELQLLHYSCNFTFIHVKLTHTKLCMTNKNKSITKANI